VDDVDVRDFHLRATEWFGRNVHAIGDGQWHDATPCSEWDVRDLLNHLVYEQRWMPPLLAGKSIADVGDSLDGDLLGDDPKAAWDDAAAEATAAVGTDDAPQTTVHLSYGDTPGARYIFEVASDLLVHGWDMARAVGADERMDEDLVELVYVTVEPYMSAMKASGLFGEEITPPPGADRQTQLLALYGRVA
jgi:uncharacterized protein (TIGR03086 family)